MDHLATLAELTNPIGSMLSECCVVHIGAEYMKYRTPCKDLFDLWRVWCDDNAIRTSLSSVGFGMKLGSAEVPIIRRQVMEAGKRFTAYQGVEILPEAYSRYLKR
jgi:phage/plasmid-associated DNA primase